MVVHTTFTHHVIPLFFTSLEAGRMLGASYLRVGLDPASRVDHDSVRRTNASTLAINPRNEDMAIVDPDDKRIMVSSIYRHDVQQVISR